jgi:hypothetical protein
VLLWRSVKLICFAKEKIGWCHKYKLYEIKPNPTRGFRLRNLVSTVFWSANNIIRSVPIVGAKVYKLGQGVLRSNAMILVSIKINPNILKMLLKLLCLINLYWVRAIAPKEPTKISHPLVGNKKKDAVGIFGLTSPPYKEAQCAINKLHTKIRTKHL